MQTFNEVPTLPGSPFNPIPTPDSIRNSHSAYLIMTTKSGFRQQILIQPMAVIGADPDVQLSIKDDAICARHARIECRNSQWLIRDLQSKSGVWLNNTRVLEAPLSDLDQIRLGETILQFCTTGESRPQLSSKNLNWNNQLTRLPSFANTDFPVLILGPSGAGKEILAQSIHQLSKRRDGPFVSINCGALSESLIESELFGHVKGAFTGATFDRKGAFEAARGGTLILDEIGDLPIGLQAKLLRAIENKEVRPVGSDRTIRTDVRILASTHKNLHQLIKTGLFREDLYWRLNVCKIEPPALGDRMEDFVDLVYCFCKEMRVRLSYHTIEKLKSHQWSGNIRELRNFVARAAAYLPGHYIQPDDLTLLLEPETQTSTKLADQVFHDMSIPVFDKRGLNTGGNIMREIEREMIIRRLSANNGNQRRTASDLGMPKSTLHDRLKAYSIDIDKIKNPIHLN